MATEQRDDKWLKQATAAQITTAQEAGELDNLLGIVRNEAGNTVNQLRGVVSRGQGGY